MNINISPAVITLLFLMNLTACLRAQPARSPNIRQETQVIVFKTATPIPIPTSATEAVVTIPTSTNTPIATNVSTVAAVEVSATSTATLFMSAEPAVTFTPTIEALPPTRQPEARLLKNCDALVYPFSPYDKVGFFLAGSVVKPVGYWEDGGGMVWYLDSNNLWLPGDCTVDLVGVLPPVSPPLMLFTATPLPGPSPTPLPTATNTPQPRWSFKALPPNFDPGWCIKVAARSVWLPDGSRYDANDGFVYLSDGALGLSLTAQVGDWFEEFKPWGCGQYR